MKTWQLAAIVLFVPSIIMGVSLLNKPAALVNKATDTNKMLANYEWFYEASNNFNSRVAQIAALKKDMAAETDKAEKVRLRTDMSAVQQSCRELASKYEAQSGKIHVGYLKGKSLPESLNAKECE